MWGRLLRCSCTACLLVATATSASGACATALGGSPCRKNVSASTPCITRTKMHTAEWRSSPSPAPDASAVDFADSLLLVPDGTDIGLKRGRVVCDTLLPDDSPVGSSVPTLLVNPGLANAVHRGVVEESCVVPASQSASQQLQSGGDADSGSSDNESGDDCVSKSDQGSSNSNKWNAGMGIWRCFLSSLSTPLIYVCSCTR